MKNNYFLNKTIIITGANQGIGLKIKKHQYNVWDKRHYLSFVEKLANSLVVLFEIFLTRNIVENKKVENKLNKILLRLSNSYCD